MTKRNNIKSQVTNASLIEKYTATIDMIARRTVDMATTSNKIDELKITVQKSKDIIEKSIKALRADKVKFGASRRTCPWSAKFFDALLSFNIKEKTANTYLSALRMSVNEGRAFSLNPSRDGNTNKRDTKNLGGNGPNQNNLVPPVAESIAGNAVKTHTDDTVEEVKGVSTNNGPDVAVAPSTGLHNQVSQIVQSVRPALDQLFLLLGNIHMRTNQDAIAAIREEISRIESEVLEAAKR